MDAKETMGDLLTAASDGIANGLGYGNISNLLISVLALRNWLVFIEAFLLSIVITLLLSLTSFIETYMYAPVFGLIIFNVLIASTVITGLHVALRVKKERFDFGEILRAGTKGVGQNFLLYLSFNMAQASDIYVWLPVFIWTLFTGVNFAKTGRNMAVSGLIDGDMAKILLKQFSDKYQINTDIKIKTDEDKSEGDRSDPQL